MSFWRDDVIGFALDQETRRHVEEQLAWIAREPDNAIPYFQLAQLCRMQGQADRALGLLLEAVRLDGAYADAHVALAEIYAVRSDYGSAWRHARAARQHGNLRAVELLQRHGIAEPN
jgi:cytochrome c-type biogenesis protein CcmH/NrfG